MEDYQKNGLIYCATCNKPSEAQSKAQVKYDKANTTQIRMKLNLKTDADILAKLESVGNKQGYIKALIRADIEKE